MFVLITIVCVRIRVKRHYNQRAVQNHSIKLLSTFLPQLNFAKKRTFSYCERFSKSFDQVSDALRKFDYKR